MPVLWIIDIDETLFITDARIRVLDGQGNEVGRLNGKEFKTYQLKPGQRFDFSEFDDADLFLRTARPVDRMTHRVKEIMKSLDDGSFTIFLTARSDMDDRDAFLTAFRRAGIEIERAHIERAGNLQHEPRGHKRKAIVIDKYLRRNEFDRAIMFDDDEDNLLEFLRLHPTYPEIEMLAYLANPNGELVLFETREKRERGYGAGRRSRERRMK